MAKQSTAFTFRLPTEELAALEQVGQSVSEYLRKTAAFHPAISVLAKPQVNVFIGTSYSQYGTPVVRRNSTPSSHRNGQSE